MTDSNSTGSSSPTEEWATASARASPDQPVDDVPPSELSSSLEKWITAPTSPNQPIDALPSSRSVSSSEVGASPFSSPDQPNDDPPSSTSFFSQLVDDSTLRTTPELPHDQGVESTSRDVPPQNTTFEWGPRRLSGTLQASLSTHGSPTIRHDLDQHQDVPQDALPPVNPPEEILPTRISASKTPLNDHGSLRAGHDSEPTQEDPPAVRGVLAPNAMERTHPPEEVSTSSPEATTSHSLPVTGQQQTQNQEDPSETLPALTPGPLATLTLRGEPRQSEGDGPIHVSKTRRPFDPDAKEFTPNTDRSDPPLSSVCNQPRYHSNFTPQQPPPNFPHFNGNLANGYSQPAPSPIPPSDMTNAMRLRVRSTPFQAGTPPTSFQLTNGQIVDSSGQVATLPAQPVDCNNKMLLQAGSPCFPDVRRSVHYPRSNGRGIPPPAPPTTLMNAADFRFRCCEYCVWNTVRDHT